jgi:hypothetical protein
MTMGFAGFWDLWGATKTFCKKNYYNTIRNPPIDPLTSS